MFWLDIIVLAVAIYAAIKGYKSGLILQVSYLGGIVVAAFFSGFIAQWIIDHISLSPESMVIAKPVSFIIAFVIILCAVGFIGKLLTKTLSVAKLGLPNRLAGLAFCVLKYLFIISILFNMADMLPYTETTEKAKTESTSYELLKPLARTVLQWTPFRKALAQIPTPSI